MILEFVDCQRELATLETSTKGIVKGSLTLETALLLHYYYHYYHCYSLLLIVTHCYSLLLIVTHCYLLHLEFDI